MSTLGMSCRVVVGALLVGLTASCSQPPPPSAETAALEGSLLTGADCRRRVNTEHLTPVEYCAVCGWRRSLGPTRIRGGEDVSGAGLG